MIARLRREPVLISQAAAVIIALLAAWGLALTEVQTAAVMGACAFIGAIIGRSQVTPTVDVGAEQDDTGLVAGPAAEVPEGNPVEVIIPGTTLDMPESSDRKADAVYYDPKHDAPEDGER